MPCHCVVLELRITFISFECTQVDGCGLGPPSSMAALTLWSFTDSTNVAINFDCGFVCCVCVCVCGTYLFHMLLRKKNPAFRFMLIFFGLIKTANIEWKYLCICYNYCTSKRSQFSWERSDKGSHIFIVTVFSIIFAMWLWLPLCIRVTNVFSQLYELRVCVFIEMCEVWKYWSFYR